MQKVKLLIDRYMIAFLYFSSYLLFLNFLLSLSSRIFYFKNSLFYIFGILPDRFNFAVSIKNNLKILVLTL